MSVLEAESPLTDELIAWTTDRFEGKPVTDTLLIHRLNKHTSPMKAIPNFVDCA
jgi:hypothetical protein